MSSNSLRTIEAFKGLQSLQPLVAGHMFKKSALFTKRYFALYEGGLLVYYKNEKSFTKDVKKHQGMPLHSKLIKLQGVYLSWPEQQLPEAKFSFVLHAPEKSNHKNEFMLACFTKKDMNIWIDQIESQNPDLIPCDNKGTLKKTPYYIKKMRLQRFRSNSSSNMSELDQDSIKKASYPGDLASMAISKSLPNFTKMHFKCTKV